MDALLILGGLLLILIGLVWLVMRGFATSLLWGFACLLPPLILLFVVRQWRRARQAVVVIGLGFIPLIVGLTVMAAEAPQRLEAILNLQWLQSPAQSQATLNMQLNGRFNGEPFIPQQGELVDGVLSLREGQDFLARRELVIRGLPFSSEGGRVDVLPSDQGRLPRIELNWLQPEQDLPESRQLAAGYSLHLDLHPVADNRLAGDFHLVLPAQFDTSLSGRVELQRSGLHYRNGAVDRTLDSRDTLAYVLSEYLRQRYATRHVQLPALPVVNLPARQLSFPLTVQIDGRAQRLALRLSKHPQSGWQVDAESPVVSAGSPAVASAPPAIDPRRTFSLVTLLSDPQRYVNQPMRVVSEQGTASQGQFVELDAEGQIVLRQRLNGSGEARFTVQPTEVAHIELLDQ